MTPQKISATAALNQVRKGNRSHDGCKIPEMLQKASEEPDPNLQSRGHVKEANEEHQPQEMNDQWHLSDSRQGKAGKTLAEVRPNPCTKKKR